MAANESDWRLRDQQKYLHGATLYLRPYRAPRPDWDHDHCDFCWQKFMEVAHAGTVQEGWTTAEEYRWVCSPCFEDFETRFRWVRGEESPPSPSFCGVRTDPRSSGGPSRPRIVAVDWSGALQDAERKIQLAEAGDGERIRLEGGRDREALADHLIQEAAREPHMVVGLDFAFSFPAWFVQEFGGGSAKAVWEKLAGGESERILRQCAPPFWGRPGKGRPRVDAEFRRTETETASVGGIRPKSVFQIGGAGAVGTGSLRGMPTLHRLSRAGFHIWPFDRPGWPLVVEIYPRILTGKVHKSRREECARYLRERHPSLPQPFLELAAASEDAFDAAVSALVMARHLDELSNLSTVVDAQLQMEGIIWAPRALSRRTLCG